jgi:hypothetical protein
MENIYLAATGCNGKGLRGVALAGALLAWVGCGTEPPPEPPPPSGPSVTVRFDEDEVVFEPTDAVVTTFEKGLVVSDEAIGDASKTLPAVVHRIFLANYDLGLSAAGDYQTNPIAPQHAEGLRVEIQIEDQEGATPGSSLRPGTYQLRAEPYDRVSWASIARLQDGRDRTHMLGGAAAAGTVTILSNEGGSVTGQIDVSDSDGSVRGKFRARTLRARTLD